MRRLCTLLTRTHTHTRTQLSSAVRTCVKLCELSLLFIAFCRRSFWPVLIVSAPSGYLCECVCVCVQVATLPCRFSPYSTPPHSDSFICLLDITKHECACHFFRLADPTSTARLPPLLATLLLSPRSCGFSPSLGLTFQLMALSLKQPSPAQGSSLSLGARLHSNEAIAPA